MTEVDLCEQMGQGEQPVPVEDLKQSSSPRIVRLRISHSAQGYRDTNKIG